MKSKYRFFAVIVCCFSLLTVIAPTVTSQTQQTALLTIQQADTKLIETVSLLENVAKSSINIRDLVINTDYARQLIVLAKVEYNDANYTMAYDFAKNATEELDIVVDELELRIGKNQQNNTILFSLLGVFSALLLGVFIFFFIRKLYPWYLEKQNEEYGKLEIRYKEETEGANDE